MVAICPRKYQRPRISGYSGYGGRGRPGFVAPKQQLHYTIIPYTGYWAVQQYSSTAVQQRQQHSSLSHHTRRAVVGGCVPGTIKRVLDVVGRRR